MKILERVEFFFFFQVMLCTSAGFLIMSIACSGAEFELITLHYLDLLRM